VAEPVENGTTYIAPAPMAPAPAPPARHNFFSFFSTPQPQATDWRSRFLQTARDLGDQGISYDEDWCPPGESRSWTMDCSNTARYIYRVTAGIQLPRTASDQYYYLHLQDKAWDVPLASNGFADCNYLRENLKPGDLLFWENTYRPERQPPITHVMIFLGTNERGEWIMAGSQTGPGGEHNRRHGGPDIYVFNPTRPCGGYTTWLGLVHHQGRFCAYGRPLEADPAKLAMAAND
jgi:cell wall-associated NlpC family hydrolase